ncbi:MAG: thioredoxin domain-containing protein [Myxococcota bacterium]|jgi:protein-disulfide isomerase|nr:thioredoxin domain-containing protein [bacterium]MDP6074052.1 thioredoxin domain-containing protein [Myxococcota bacterium]MDP6242701.1 thioredoxin domain-containing protein [Myxococcota bacterium]MDP7073427.1 thioredoxin domain-containing protein [Myxococcota bacterium]MDP7300060.1 thioredoxin domain-containing protein [Myxococcota bacterium]
MNRSLMHLGVLALLLASACRPSGDAAPAADNARTGTSEIAAEVNGEPISVAELDEWIKEDLFQSRTGKPNELYDLRTQALNAMFEERVLESEAARRGVDVETLIEQETAAQGPITDADVSGWYTENQERLGETEFADIADQIRSFLSQQREKKTREVLLENAELIVRLEPPRAQISVEGPSKGPEDALVTIVEFSDFQCPYCSRVLPTLTQVMERYPEDVRIVYRNFPLPSHQRASAAAEAALCAQEQGKFWAYHDKLFENSRALSDDQLKDHAKKLELDVPAFEQCQSEERFEEQIQNDVREARAAGVTGTPAFFVNGVLLSGARPAADFYRTIDAELERLKPGA